MIDDTSDDNKKLDWSDHTDAMIVGPDIESKLPKSVVIDISHYNGENETFGHRFNCPACGDTNVIARWNKFCPECGVKISFSPGIDDQIHDIDYPKREESPLVRYIRGGKGIEAIT